MIQSWMLDSALRSRTLNDLFYLSTLFQRQERIKKKEHPIRSNKVVLIVEFLSGDLVRR